MDRKIILDTNFLVAPFQFSFELFEEVERIYPLAEIYTIEDVVQEARSIEGGKYRELVEKFLETQNIEVLETQDEEANSSRKVEGKGGVDDLLVELSDRYIVATNDKELKERILERGNPVMIIRQKNYLEVVHGRKEDL